MSARTIAELLAAADVAHQDGVQYPCRIRGCRNVAASPDAYCRRCQGEIDALRAAQGRAGVLPYGIEGDGYLRRPLWQKILLGIALAIVGGMLAWDVAVRFAR